MLANGGIFHRRALFPYACWTPVIRSSSYRMQNLNITSSPSELIRGFKIADLGTNGLNLHKIGLADSLVRSSLDNTSGPGELRTNAHEIGVNVACCLATFVDAPE